MTIITREKLVAKLTLWRAIPERDTYTDDELAEACAELSECIVGVHDSRPIKAAAAYKLLTGRRLSL